ncbi:hypothetical protein [Halorhabdus sp. CUG00001]|uniref:hypothetical protein n=1 Tax=Halorhabdus sp. CUG00001 TaxID=2600297 RepID=UPI00131BFBF9|nr:hypothetical protein [Halorhabdus sp. CUG00001]
MKRGFDELLNGNRNFSVTGDRLLAMLFGDRVGLVLFLGILTVVPLCWRIGFFITDNYAVANTVVNVAAGHLEITRIEYSLTLGSQPGLYQRGASVFGRNYGQAVLAAPVYWMLEIAAMLTELRLLLAGFWSFAVAAFATQLARVLERRSLAVWGTVLAVGLFVWNVELAHSLDPQWTGLLALQIVSMGVAAAVAVVYYRLVTMLYGRKAAVAVGLLVALATPVLFWASIPKRHVLSALLIGFTVVGFAASRQESEHATRARALAYVGVGLLAWVQEAEALPMLIVLLPLDLTTAPNNGRRQLATVAAAFAASLVPFLLTNLLITGSPLRTSQMLPSVGEHLQIAADGTVSLTEQAADVGGGAPGGDGGETAGVPTPNGMTGGTSPETDVLGQLFSVVWVLYSGLSAPLMRAWDILIAGITIVWVEPSRLVDVFIRSGRISGIQHALNEQEAIELTLLESVPVASALAAVPVLVLSQLRMRDGQIRDRIIRFSGTPRFQTGLLAVGIVVVFSLSYLRRLPIHAQITVRYLLPIMPLLVYLVVCLPPVRRGLQADVGGFLGTYIGTIVVGLPIVVLILYTLDPAIGEAMQLHALLHLAVGALTVLAVAFGAVGSLPVSAARAIATTAATTTVLYLLAGIEYFTYGELALPVVRWFSQLLALF